MILGLLLGIICVIIFVYAFSLIRHYTSPLRVVPGDKWLYYPITGDVGWALDRNCKIIDKFWSRLTTVGDIWRTNKYYGEIRLVIARPEVVRAILTSDSANYSRGDYKGVEGLVILGGLNNILTASGATHRILRKVASPGFRPSILKLSVQRVEETAKLVVGRWKEAVAASNGAATIKIHDDITDFTLNTLALVGMGMDWGCLKSKTPVAYAVTRIVRAAYLNLWCLVPFIQYLGHFAHYLLVKQLMLLPSFPGFRNVSAKDIKLILRTVREQIDACQSGRIGQIENSKCLLRVILDNCEKGAITKENMISLLVLFILAGTETSSLALTWTLWNLAEHPDIQEDVSQECQEYLKSHDQLTWEDVHDDNVLQNTKLVLRESMRLYPPVHMVIRRNLVDVEVDGYHIPKGTDFQLAIVAMHRNPMVWGDDALEWKPYREFHEEAYMPFGDGAHKCIGYQLAMVEMIAALTHILATFRFERLPGDQTEPKIGFTLAPDPPVQLRVQLRE